MNFKKLFTSFAVASLLGLGVAAFIIVTHYAGKVSPLLAIFLCIAFLAFVIYGEEKGR